MRVLLEALLYDAERDLLAIAEALLVHIYIIN